MCGIFAIFSKEGEPIDPRLYHGSLHTLREIAYRQSGKQRHRGPDDTGIEVMPEDGVVLVQERLAVIGVATGHQPFVSDDGNVVLVANAEIYNYKSLAAGIAKTRGQYKPKSDCNVIVELYEEYGERLLEHINGMFAFVLYDKASRSILIARDPFGIMPLYMGKDADGNVWLASEMKCLVEFCSDMEVFPPGHYAKATIGGELKPKRYFDRHWLWDTPTKKADLDTIRKQLVAAVRSHLQSDVPIGALLSGGLDSSLIASIVTKIMREHEPSYRLRTFAVGMTDAPDFKAARLVAEHIGSEHTEITFTVEQCMDAARDLIYHLESYDVGTVRCSLPMFQIVRHIRSTGIKVLLCGEGADEIFGGYLYFFKAPNVMAFHQQSVRCLEQLHLSDILRANKVTMSAGLELRVPFLETDFVSYVMSIRPADKIPGPLNCFGDVQTSRMEKFVLRAAFERNYLPDAVLWRQKEQFSDGVGYELLDSVPKYTAERVTDAELAQAAELFPINTPTNKEAFFYRRIFHEYYPSDAAALAVTKWAPPAGWNVPMDPSGRAQEAHICSKN